MCETPPAGAVSRKAGLALTLIALLCACGAGRGATESEALPECVSYASSAQACFGKRVAERLRKSFATPPSDSAARAALRAQCADHDAELRLACR